MAAMLNAILDSLDINQCHPFENYINIMHTLRNNVMKNYDDRIIRIQSREFG